MVGRHKGTKNKPDAKKPGVKPGYRNLPEIITTEEQLRIKREVLKLFDDREVDTLSEAADIVGISKLKLYRWRHNDPNWKTELAMAEQLIADEILRELADMKGDKDMPYAISLMFRLKKIRPEYRDSYKKIEFVNPTVEKFLKAFQDAGKKVEEKENN